MTLLLRVLQWLLLVIVGLYIYTYIIATSLESGMTFLNLKNIFTKNWPYVVLLFILSPLNSITEAKKWQISITDIIPNIPLISALKMVYVGATAGLITPSKIGEYGGRLVGIPS